MFQWLYNLLTRQRDKKRQEVLRLKWEKAELEAKIRRAKEENEKNC